MTRRAIPDVLAELDRPVTPRPEFAEELFALLEAEMADRPEEPAPRRPAAERSARRWFARPVAVAAGVLIVAVTAVALGTLPGGTPSALAAFQQATAKVASAPPISATVEQRQFGDVIAEERRQPAGSLPDLVTVKQYSWADRDHYRSDVASNSYQERIADRGALELPEGSYTVADGEYSAVYNALEKTLLVEPLAAVPDDSPLRGMGLLDPNLHYFSTFTDAEFNERCELLADDIVADRPAKHIRCTDPDVQQGRDVIYDLWLDNELGLVLRYDIDGMPTGSGFLDVSGTLLRVQDLTADAEFEPDAFDIEIPDGAEAQWLGRPPAPPQFEPPEPPNSLRVNVPGLQTPVAVEGGDVWVGGVKGGRGQYFEDGIGTIVRLDGVTGDVLTTTTLRPMRSKPRRARVPLVTPTQIVVDGDEVWVAEDHVGATRRTPRGFAYRYRIEQIDQISGELKGRPVELPGEARGMVSVQDSLWVAADLTRTEIVGPAQLDLGEVQQVDQRSGKLVHRLRIDAAPVAIAAAEDDRSVWVLAAEPNRQDVYASGTQVLYRVDGRTGRVASRTELPTDPRDQQFSDAISVGGGSVFVTADDGGRGRVIKVDARSAKVRSVAKVGVAPASAAYGLSALWVLDAEQNEVLRVDPRTLDVTKAQAAGTQARSMALGDHGLWVTSAAGAVRFFKVDP